MNEEKVRQLLKELLEEIGQGENRRRGAIRLCTAAAGQTSIPS